MADTEKTTPMCFGKGDVNLSEKCAQCVHVLYE